MAHAKLNLPTKTCLVCGRPFKWRKKWVKVWEQVKYCGERCRRHGKEGCEQMSVGSATLEDFEKLDIRVGKVVEITPYPEGRYSTHILLVNFGSELGTKKSLAKLAPNYADSDILGRQVLCVVNFPPRQIGKHQSEVLTLGVPDENGNVVLLRPDTDVPLGGRLY